MLLAPALMPKSGINTKLTKHTKNTKECDRVWFGLCLHGVNDFALVFFVAFVRFVLIPTRAGTGRRHHQQFGRSAVRSPDYPGPGSFGQCVSLTLGCILCAIMHMLKSAVVIRELKAAGWVLSRIRGSHHVFSHPSRPGRVVVPHPKKDLGIGLVAAIRKHAGL